LKNFDEEGFFLPIIIQKREAIDQNPNICLSFFGTMERQVIIKGIAKNNGRNSDRYFDSDLMAVN
jgi:pyridoxine/pyridoxamine 5'-phosphate oxidase